MKQKQLQDMNLPNAGQRKKKQTKAGFNEIRQKMNQSKLNVMIWSLEDQMLTSFNQKYSESW